MSSVRVIKDAVIIPAISGLKGGGVCDAKGKFVEESTIWRDDARLYARAQVPDDVPGHLPGTHLYGGILSWHFGHFIVESLSRLWAMDAPPEPYDSVVFIPKGRADRERDSARFHDQVFGVLTPGMVPGVINVPTRVDRLIVPEQGFGSGKLEAGLPEFRDFIANRTWPEPDPDSPKWLYVSRLGLSSRKKGRVIGDHALAKHLESVGFTLFQPEKHSFEEQLKAYRGAHRLVFDDGSALHSFGLVAQDWQTVASIQRRFSDGVPVAQRQLRSFANIDLKVIDAVIREWRPRGVTRATSKSHGELNMDHLLSALDGFGALIEGSDAVSLGLPTAEEAAAEMAEIDYTPVERSDPLPEPPARAHFWGVAIPPGPHLDKRKLRSLRDGFFEKKEVEAGMANVQPEDRLLELGAGSGIVGSAVALNSGASAVLSFEANPQLIDHARGLYKRNGLQDRIMLRNAILTAGPDQPWEISFAVAEDYLGSRILHNGEKPRNGETVVPVPTQRFDDVVAEFRPTALMMDIEGGELELLENGNLSAFRLVIVELHRGIYGREGMRRCRAALEAAGLAQNPEYCRRGVETWVRPAAD